MKKIISIFLKSFIIWQVSISYSEAIEPASKNIFEGIDVSNWQGNVNFYEVARQGIKIVYIKATQGTRYVSPVFESQYKNAKDNGLKIGFYHYVTARTEEEAMEEARFFASKIKGKEIDCRLAMDFERFGELSKNEINKVRSSIYGRII